jgi:hypothetical protein
MANRVDTTYFVRELRLSDLAVQVGTPSALYTEQAEQLTAFITKYEPEFLKLLLGDDLYTEYVADYATTKWAAFDALMFDTALKDSPVADYIFCKYWADADTEARDGTLLVNGEAKNRISADARLLPVWNAMVKKIITAIDYLSENYDTFCTTYEYNYDGWTSFVWWNGSSHCGRYVNYYGL